VLSYIPSLVSVELYLAEKSLLTTLFEPPTPDFLDVQIRKFGQVQLNPGCERCVKICCRLVYRLIGISRSVSTKKIRADKACAPDFVDVQIRNSGQV
jgi:hypothetical protein